MWRCVGVATPAAGWTFPWDGITGPASTAAASLGALINTWGLVGIDINYEQFGTTTAADFGTWWCQIFQALRNQFPALIITLCPFSGEGSPSALGHLKPRSRVAKANRWRRRHAWRARARQTPRSPDSWYLCARVQASTTTTRRSTPFAHL